MFVSGRRLKASLNFIQQGFSYIFQRLVLGKCNLLFKLLPIMPRLNERAVFSHKLVGNLFDTVQYLIWSLQIYVSNLDVETIRIHIISLQP